MARSIREDLSTKRCPLCKGELPASAFNKNAGSYDGRQPYCRPCSKAKRQLVIDRRKAGLLPVIVPLSKTCNDIY